MVENVNIGMVTAPAPVALEAGSETPFHAASEITREVQAYQERISQLARAIFNQLHTDGTGELSVKLSELSERSAALEHAISTNDSSIIAQRAAEVAAYITANYGHFREAIDKAETDEEQRKKGRKLAESLYEKSAEIHAQQVAQTQRFMNDNIEGFKELREPAQRYVAENTNQMIQNDPFYKETFRIQQVLGDDPIMQEQKKKAEDAYKELMALAERTHNDELKQQLLHMKDRLGKEENMPELIDLNKRVQDNISGGMSEKDAAADAAQTMIPKVEQCNKANDVMQMKAYERLPADLQNVLKSHLGGEVSAEKLRELVDQFKKEGKLNPDAISDAVERLEALKKEGKGFAQLSKDDQLLLAVAQQNFNVETGKNLFGMAKHLARLKEKEPEQYAKLMDQYKELVSHHDVDGLMQLMKDSGLNLADSATPEGRAVYQAIADMSPEDAQKVVVLAAKAADGDEAARKELKQVFRDNVQMAINKRYNEEVDDGEDINGKVCRRLDFENSNDRLTFDMMLLKSTYKPTETASPQAQPVATPRNGFFDEIVAETGALLGWNNSAENSNQQMASLEDTLIPDATPQNEGTQAIMNAPHTPQAVG